MKKMKSFDCANFSPNNIQNSNVTIKLLKMNEPKSFTVGMFKDLPSNDGKVAINNNSNNSTTINMITSNDSQQSNGNNCLNNGSSEMLLRKESVNSSIKSSNLIVNKIHHDSKNSFTSEMSKDESINNNIMANNSSLSSESEVSKNFFNINESKASFASEIVKEELKVIADNKSNKNSIEIHKQNKSSVEHKLPTLSSKRSNIIGVNEKNGDSPTTSTTNTEVSKSDISIELKDNKKSNKSITTQLFEENNALGSAAVNVNTSTPKTSVTELLLNNRKSFGAQLKESRNSAEVNVSQINSTSGTDESNSLTQRKDSVELNIVNSSSALTDSSNNKSSNMSNYIGIVNPSLATEITNITNNITYSNNKIDINKNFNRVSEIQSGKSSSKNSSNEIQLKGYKGFMTDNPAFVDSIEDEKRFESVKKGRESSKLHNFDSEDSVCYDNKDDVLKNILLIQQHNEEIARKKAIKFKSIFRRKKSSSIRNNPLLKFSSFKSNFEDMNGPKEQNHYVVELRVVFYKVGEIDTLKEKFYAEAFIEASWIDPFLDPNKQYHPKQNWNPDILILNSIGVLKEEIWHTLAPFKENNNRIVMHQSQTDMNQSDCICTKICDLDETKQKAGCLVIERRRVNGMFWQLLDLKDFPSDVQNLTLSISTSKHSNEITLLHSREVYSSVNANSFLDHQEWHLYKHVKVKEFLRDSVFTSVTFPAVDLTICVARRPTFYYLNAFFLIFLITISSLAVFSVNCNLPQNRLQTSCTLLLTSATFKWVTNRSLPTVSYMTLLDKYSLGCIILVCMQCIWLGVIGFLNQTEIKFAKYDLLAFLTMCTLFCLLNFSFIIIFIRNGYCKRRGLHVLEEDYINNLAGKRVTRFKSMFHGI